MMQACPRCSNPGFPGWVFYDDYLVECLSCGYILRDMTPITVNYEKDWKYRPHKLFSNYHRKH